MNVTRFVKFFEMDQQQQFNDLSIAVFREYTD